MKEKPLSLQLWEAKHGPFAPWLAQQLRDRSVGSVALELKVSRPTLWRWMKIVGVSRRMEVTLRP